ncbi:NlpC/P60 family protein [Streptomyces roseolus]|uniref:NlpC/P60 family protein n=1 Tax=Streptomyces roseolus TaxID=67358 RepID=UPI00379B5D4C
MPGLFPPSLTPSGGRRSSTPPRPISAHPASSSTAGPAAPPASTANASTATPSGTAPRPPPAAGSSSTTGSRARSTKDGTPPRPGDLVFWDTDPNDGIRYGGDLDHTGVYIGNGQAIDANASYGRVKDDSVTLGGTERDPLYVEVLAPNGY